MFRIRPQVLHSVAKDVYIRRQYMLLGANNVKSFGLKNVKGLASEIHFQIILKIMLQSINAFGSDKIQKACANFLFQNGFCKKHIKSQISHS